MPYCDWLPDCDWLPGCAACLTAVGCPCCWLAALLRLAAACCGWLPCCGWARLLVVGCPAAFAALLFLLAFFVNLGHGIAVLAAVGTGPGFLGLGGLAVRLVGLLVPASARGRSSPDCRLPVFLRAAINSSCPAAACRRAHCSLGSGWGGLGFASGRSGPHCAGQDAAAALPATRRGRRRRR